MDKFSAGQLRDLAELIWGEDLPTPPDHRIAEYTMWQIAEGLRNSAMRREWIGENQ